MTTEYTYKSLSQVSAGTMEKPMIANKQQQNRNAADSNRIPLTPETFLNSHKTADDGESLQTAKTTCANILTATM